MPLLLDTVTLSELRKGSRIHPSVRKWQVGIGEVWISVVTLQELRYGMRMVEGRDPVFAARLAAWYGNLISQSRRFRILDVDRAVAEQAAEYRAVCGTSLPDALIAGTAKVHGLTVATRNLADFEGCGIDLVDPWGFSG